MVMVFLSECLMEGFIVAFMIDMNDMSGKIHNLFHAGFLHTFVDYLLCHS